MFEKKVSKNLWILLGALLVLVLISIILQAQLLVMVSDLQTNFFGSWFSDSNPLPPMREMFMDTNPLPAKEMLMDTNPLPAIKF